MRSMVEVAGSIPARLSKIFRGKYLYSFSFLFIMVTLRTVLETSIIPGFTIAAALIWKDVIVEALGTIWPHDGRLFSQVIAAVVTTVLVAIAVYVLLETEEEAEKVLNRFRNPRLRKP